MGGRLPELAVDLGLGISLEKEGALWYGSSLLKEVL
jgi:hypothetical protein